MLLCLQTHALAQTFPDRPQPSDFFVDAAGIIAEAEAEQINAIAAELLEQDQIPLYVVTIRSLAEFDAAGMGIESYARALFDEWGIGSRDHNVGMLLLISHGDRKARIELGADWEHQYDTAASSIMNTLLVPNFKSGDYSVGILEGARGLVAMARGIDLPRPPASYSWLAHGCSGTLGFPGNVASSEPRVGSVLTGEISRCPRDSALLAFDFRRVDLQARAADIRLVAAELDRRLLAACPCRPRPAPAGNRRPRQLEPRDTKPAVLAVHAVSHASRGCRSERWRRDLRRGCGHHRPPGVCATGGANAECVIFVLQCRPETQVNP